MQFVFFVSILCLTETKCRVWLFRRKEKKTPTPCWIWVVNNIAAQFSWQKLCAQTQCASAAQWLYAMGTILLNGFRFFAEQQSNRSLCETFQTSHRQILMVYIFTFSNLNFCLLHYRKNPWSTIWCSISWNRKEMIGNMFV